MKKATLFVLLTWCSLLLSGLPATAQDHSVLASGAWYKIGITASGIYKIDGKFLQSLGIDTRTLNPVLLQVYGNGAGTLPQSNNLPRPVDLIQNAVWVEGEADGRFDAEDALYFYGEGPATVFTDPVTSNFTHAVNPYSDTTFYFLTIGAVPGLRIQTRSAPSPSAPFDSAFDHYWFYEKEAVNLLHSGREWWGDYLGSTPTLSIETRIPGIISSAPAILRTRAIASAQVETRFRWTVNGTRVGEQTAGTVTTYRYDQKARTTESVYTFTLNSDIGDGLKIGLEFDKNGQASAYGYLDYVALQTRRLLTDFGVPELYRFLPSTTPVRSCELAQVSEGFRLWDVSNPLKPEAVPLHPASGTSARFTRTKATQPETYLGFHFENAQSPAAGRKIANQDLRGQPVPDMLIVTAPRWRQQAEQLAKFRFEADNIQAAVATPEEIFNEFASGKPDVTAIRDLCYSYFHRESNTFRYLLLFGDATYDFRDKVQNETPLRRMSYVPSYQSRESLHPVYTYASDDYFGLLGELDGDWSEDGTDNARLRIGVGRLPVKSEEEARLVVDKLTRYYDKRSMGAWRNRVSFVADDGDGNIHQRHADSLAKMAAADFLPARIFVDEFPQTGTALGERAPEVNRIIHRAVDTGTLILNFTGHGGVSGWTDEQVLHLADIQSLRGYHNMPLLVTATCEFGRYDDPGVVSGAELMLLSPRGAAIGAMTTTRPVFASTNFFLNQAFYEALNARAGGGRLGDIVRETKNNSLAGVLNRNFVLLGDPSMRLALPEHQVTWLRTPDTLKAGKKVTLSGQIVSRSAQQLLTTFHGRARVSVYAPADTFTTRGNGSPPESYQEFRKRLFEGEVSVREGVFNATFVVPADVAAPVKNGRVSIYVLSADSTLDASGQLALPVGNVETNPISDLTAPVLKAYLNNLPFTNGQTVLPRSTLVVELSDQSGINLHTAGCTPVAILNDTLEIALASYYSAALDDYRKGMIVMPLGPLPSGKYRMKIRACDNSGNPGETTIEFEVGKDPGIRITDAVIFPNPFHDYIRYRLAHSRETEDIELNFRLFSRTGRLLHEHNRKYYQSIRELEETISPKIPAPYIIPELQIYLFELTIRSLQDLSVHKISGKLIHK